MKNDNTKKNKGKEDNSNKRREIPVVEPDDLQRYYHGFERYNSKDFKHHEQYNPHANNGSGIIVNGGSPFTSEKKAE